MEVNTQKPLIGMKVFKKPLFQLKVNLHSKIVQTSVCEDKIFTHYNAIFRFNTNTRLKLQLNIIGCEHNCILHVENIFKLHFKIKNFELDDTKSITHYRLIIFSANLYLFGRKLTTGSR